MATPQSGLKNGLVAGIGKGWRSFIWIGRIVIPVSFLVALLQWTGWLNQIDFVLRPLTGLLNLPSQAALPILTGMLLNLYAVIAIITVLPFTPAQMTLIAVFNLIAHGLILEGLVQHRSGLNILKATFVRVAVAIVTVFIISRFLGDASQSLPVPPEILARPAIQDALLGWAQSTGFVLLKVFAIIMVIMVSLETMRLLGWLEYLPRYSRPLMKVLGLSERTSMMWVTANLFGLLYGGAVIAEEAKKGTLARNELERLHIFIGSNHAMVEDPSLFAVLGLNAFWLWVPRFVTATVAVHTYRGVSYMKDRWRDGHRNRGLAGNQR